jgi:GR25 family glycosyltransferase involved in LPS biosynthesis
VLKTIIRIQTIPAKKYRNGLNNFDKIYCINLDHRKDRLAQIEKELNKSNIESHKIQRIPGVLLKGFGALGCSKSHSFALEEFIKSSESSCIIFEDDFEFTEKQTTINTLVDRIFSEVVQFDVLMLSANIYKEEATKFDFITKILEAQTVSVNIMNTC